MKKALLIILAIFLLLPLLIILAPIAIPFLLLAGILVLKRQYPAIKGAVGERYVNKELIKLGENYRIYHDLYVPNGEGGTSQVDHVVTSPYGIFVIETKHYEGWIFGGEKQKQWTQTIYKRKEKFLNPIWQNYGHIQTIKKYIDQEDFAYIHSIIAFSQNSTFKFKEDFHSAKVIQFPQLIQTLKEWDAPVLNETQLKKIDAALERLIITDQNTKKEMKRKHVEDIKKNRKAKVLKEKEETKQHKCPKCGGALSLKKGKYGAFYGCSSYPKCRYTSKVS